VYYSYGIIVTHLFRIIPECIEGMGAFPSWAVILSPAAGSRSDCGVEGPRWLPVAITTA